MKEIRSWLIQRLNKPVGFTKGHILHGKDNPFAFGGGFRNGGLSKEAMDLLRPVFSFDYMGAAEFEFGEVPRALSGIVERINDFTTATLEVDAKDIKFDPKWDSDRYLKPEGVIPFYIFAHKDHVDYVKKVIAMDLRQDKKFQLKEVTLLPQCMFVPKKEDGYRYNVCGWLELDNGFFFFSDKEMFDKTVALFTQKEETKV